MIPLPRSRVLRWTGRALGGVALAVAFLSAGTAGVVLHANLPLARRLTARLSGEALSSVLGGTVTFDTLSLIGLKRLAVPRATLLDANSAPVLSLFDVRADVSLRGIARELLFDRGHPTIVIDHLRVEHAEVTLIADPKTGEPTIVRALTPAPSPSGVSSGSTNEGLRIYFPAIEVGLVDAHGRLNGVGGSRPLEAQVHRVQGLLLATPKGIAVDVNRFGMVLRGFGPDARGTGTLALRAPGPVRGTFEGFFGDVELKASAFLEGAHVEASVEVPGATAEAAARLLPGWPLRDAISGHVTVRGDLPTLEMQANLQAARTTIDANGAVFLGSPQGANLTVALRHFDARLLSAGAPPTDLSVDAVVHGHWDGGQLVADATAHTEPTLIADQLVPAADIDATFKDGAMSGTAKIHEPGMPLTASFKASKEGIVDVNADTGAMNLGRLPRWTVGGLRGTAHATTEVHVESGGVRIAVDGDVAGLSFEGAHFNMARGHVSARASGRLDALNQIRGTARLVGTRAAFAGVPADRVTLDARGSPKRVEFDAMAARAEGPELHAAGTATFVKRPLFTGTKISLRRDPVVIEGDIQDFDPTEGRVDIRNVHVAGAGGTMTGSARLGQDLVEIEVEGEDVNLEAVGRALGVARGTLAGTLRISANVVTGRDVTRGRVRLGLGDATLGPVGGLSAQISGDLEGRHVTGNASGLVAGVGTFGTTWDAELGGPAFESASWRDLTGRSEVQVGSVRLPLLAALLPSAVPIAKVGGQAFARVLLERKTAKDRLPNVFATASTRDLTVDVRRDPAPIHLAGVDVTATGAFNGTTGDSTGTTVAVDSHGDLLTATGAVHVDVDSLLRDPGSVFAQAVDTPIDMVVGVPSRDVADLPDWVRPTGLAGRVGGSVSVRGSLKKPTLFVSADGTGLGAEGVLGGHPVDVHANGEYEWATHALSALGNATVGGRAVATATFRGALPEGQLTAWKGDGRVELDGMPLDLAFVTAQDGVSGKLSGHAAIERDEKGGALSADVRLTDFAIENTPLGEGTLTLDTSGDTLHAKIDLSSDTGTLEADAGATVSFRAPLPALAETSPLRAHLVAHEFSAVVLSPLVRSVFARVGGHVDADLTVAVEPHSGQDGSATTWSGGVEGKASLSGGSALIDILGLDVRDLALSVEAHGQGKETAVSIQDVHGRVRSTKDNLRGGANLILDGLSVERGTGQLSLDEVPLLFRGAPQGHVTGNVSLRLARESDRILVDVEIPNLTTRLPQSSSRNVVDLSDNGDIAVVQSAKLESESSPATPWRVALHLGNDVRVKRSDVDLGVTGSPTVDLGRTVDVGGAVELTPGGRVPVLGKVFVVDHGRLIFDTGEPTNPRLDVTASWRAPNGTVVSVDVQGTLNDAQITSRSDPPLPKAEVDALLLGGSSSETGATADPNASGSGAAAGAVALGTGVAALGVNQLLSNNPVELRVESTSESRPRYTAAVRVRDNLWFEASTYQETDHSTSAGTDRSVYSGTVDYRFTPRWSLRTEAGTVGGALDLLWQYRY